MQKLFWFYREKLSKGNVAKKLFKKFDEQIQKSGLVSHEGTLIDATFAKGSKTKKQLRGKQSDEKTKHKVCQKDTDARWTKKRGETYYGYKNHVKVDADSKVITDYSVTDAAVHDSKRFLGFINEGEDKNVYADSAYRSKELEEKVKEMGIEYSVCERIYRNKPLTEEQKERNRKLSKVRSRVEHGDRFYERNDGRFKSQEQVRSIGMTRAKSIIGLTNLGYNMFRYSMLTTA